jgi:hypothetical protein
MTTTTDLPVSAPEALTTVLADADRPLTGPEVADATGLNIATVRVALHRLAKLGTAMAVSRGRWTIALPVATIAVPEASALVPLAESYAETSVVMPRYRSYGEIEALDPEALWPGKIPFSEPTLLVGAGGVGKGMLTADLIARVTRGDAMPDGSRSSMPAGNVITVLPEDDAIRRWRGGCARPGRTCTVSLT